MLRELEVRDLGIIEAVRLELPPGFAALTGETGAGKSLLVQSLQLLAGGRADAEQVRGGCARLLVDATFELPAAAAGLLAELGVDGQDTLAVRREVTAGGRSRAWLNDVPVTVGALQRLAPYLLAIHGQHEQRGLTDPATHLALVDAAAGLDGAREEVGALFAAWQDLVGQLAAQLRSLATRRDRLDVIAFQLREIEEARVEAGEDEQLREERTLLRHSERIGELLRAAQEALGGQGGTVSLARAAKAVHELAALGLGLVDSAEALDQARVLAEDAERELDGLGDRVRVDPQRLEAVEARLAVLERLARKYGGSLPAALEHHAALLEERAQLEGVEDDIARLEAAAGDRLAAYAERAVELSGSRRRAAETFAREVVTVLARLGMPKVRLELRLSRRLDADGPLALDGARVRPAADGIDVAEFYISPNPGEEPRPLARIASGGELSRIHLALRTVLRERAQREPLTLLFDEVDSGIGGRVADELGVLLAALGARDQVLVVTHLPQVAARAGTHVVVSKQASKGRTVTRVAPVADEARVEELVRMLGGPGTPAARQHARELLRSP